MVGGGGWQKEKGGDAAQAYVIVMPNDRLLYDALVDSDGVIACEFLDAPAGVLSIDDTGMGTRDGWVGEHNIVSRVATNGDGHFGELEASSCLGAAKDGNLAQSRYILVVHAQSPTCYVHDELK
jgi:hypothetical protein